MDSFFVHLQSDASWQHYSNNTRTNYRNHLAIPIKVEASEYEVALCEVSYNYNIPYIKKNTLLYKVRTVVEAEGKPKIKVTQYPKISDLKGPNQKSTSRNVYKSILEYAKKENIHIPYAEQIFETKKYRKGSAWVMMIESSMDIISSKELNSTKDIVDDLNIILKNLEMVVEYKETTEDKKTVQEVRFKQNKPPLMATQDVIFYDKLEKHFQIGTEDENYYVEADNNYQLSTIASNEKINIKAGELLCRVYFYTAEAHMPPRSRLGNEEDDKNLRLAGFTPRDLQSLNELITSLNAIHKNFQFKIEKERCVLTAKDTKNSILELNERVQAILGLDFQNDIILPANTTIVLHGKQLPIFNIGARKIYVYADCIQEQRVGDQMAPILRMTDYSGVQDQLEIKKFNNLHYIKCSKDYIDSIRIYLRTEIGEECPLSFGSSSCTLHFRTRRL